MNNFTLAMSILDENRNITDCEKTFNSLLDAIEFFKENEVKDRILAANVSDRKGGVMYLKMREALNG